MGRELTHLSLFSGIGGLDLAAEWAGFRTVGQCEWADYPRAVLEKHWPGLPRWRDVRTLTKESFYEQTGLESITVLSGGFPCQPFSTAGKRRGKDDDRYLWPEMLRVIQEIRPRWVVGENVAGIVSLALDQVLSDLEGIGYTCQAFIIPACAVDAPHRRDRCAIVGYSKYNGSSTTEIPGSIEEAGGNISQRSEETRKLKGTSMREHNETVEHTDKERRNQQQSSNFSIKTGLVSESDHAPGNVSNFNNKRLQESGFESEFEEVFKENRIEFLRRWEFECRMGGMADGVSYWLDEPEGVPRVNGEVKNRVNRIQCLGNAVVPQQFHPFFAAIASIEQMMEEQWGGLCE